ncbi:head decoration protein [Rhizobiaceae bacterium n13]|uniref:head decoration protein n=1 Tax=Ferirhizobium litorale TaxID=2927786 RepID=UPI0024B2CD75|nr:head decoration protein [Fererhizobium litorale]MDI7864305.1 head decoration protein [Fererhizobium litorale]
MPPIATETPRDLGFLLTELPGTLSRDVVTIASGSGKLEPGTLLAKLTAGGKYVPSPATGADGSQTAIAVLAYAVDASSADAEAVVVANDAEVKKPMLIYDASVDDDTKRNAKLTQLRALNIKAR